MIPYKMYAIYYKAGKIKHMNTWLHHLHFDPTNSLLSSDSEAIVAYTKQDLLGEDISLTELWQLSEPQKILQLQMPDGSWKSGLYETFRNLGVLIEMYGFKNDHPAIARAAGYVFSTQSKEGDFRGVYGNQYSPNYSAAIAELLIKAGYADDTHIKKHFEWLLATRQKDGGWALPFRTKGHGINVINDCKDTIQPDLAKPYSYMVTGVVLRAFAAHPEYKKSKEAHEAGKLLASSIFQRDNYPDRAAPEFWLRFSFPFDYTHLVSALDSLSLIGFPPDAPQIKKALDWLVDNQEKTGTWDFRIVRGANKDNIRLWLTLATCRIFKRFYE